MIIDNVIEEARSYLGTTWVHQGRSRRGVDCVGFLLLSFMTSGIKLNDSRGYARKPDGIMLKKMMDGQKSFMTVGKNDIKAGDVLLFRIRHDPQHVGLVVPSKTAKFGMIHSYNGGEKKVVEHDLADYWIKKIVAVYRLIE